MATRAGTFDQVLLLAGTDVRIVTTDGSLLWQLTVDPIAATGLSVAAGL